MGDSSASQLLKLLLRDQLRDAVVGESGSISIL